VLFVDGSGAFHPDGLSGPSPAANQTSAEASVIDLPHAKGRASASLWRCAMPQMAARIFQPDAKLCYAMRLTIMSAAWIYGSRIAGDADQVAGMIAPSLRGVSVFACPRPQLATGKYRFRSQASTPGVSLCRVAWRSVYFAQPNFIVKPHSTTRNNFAPRLGKFGTNHAIPTIPGAGCAPFSIGKLPCALRA